MRARQVFRWGRLQGGSAVFSGAPGLFAVLVSRLIISPEKLVGVIESIRLAGLWEENLQSIRGRILLGICFQREGFEAAFGPERKGGNRFSNG